MKQLRAFTLIELLVVIAIIGILASIIVGGLNGAKMSGRDARRVSDIKNIQLSLALYYNDNGHYPCRIDTTGAVGQCVPNFFGTYMTTLPRDPSNNALYTYSALSTGGNCNAVAPTAYHLGATMETTNFLGQDLDWAFGAQSAYNDAGCTGSAAKFDGNAASVVAGVTNCTGTAAAGTESCYDVGNDF